VGATDRIFCSAPSAIYKEDENMASYKTQGTSYGELMKQLLNERSRFDSEEEFQSYARDEVRQFIADLRSINIELTMRPTYGGQPLSHHSVTQKLAKP
jgi:hypothetical protein